MSGTREAEADPLLLFRIVTPLPPMPGIQDARPEEIVSPFTFGNGD